jgi:hypothetical protein
MATKDFRHRESKKPKKDAKKSSIPISFTQPAEVELIRKARKPKEEEEEE